MRGFLAAVKVELASLARSKAAALLVVACAALALAAPHVLRGDGTAQSAFRLDVRYTLGAAFALVLVSMAASAAGSISRDRESRRLQLALVRPVSPSVLALARISAVTLCGSLALGAVCAILAFRAGLSLPCDHAYAPRLEDPMKAARRLYDEYCAEYPDFRAEAEKAGRYQTLRYLAEYEKTRLQTIPPGETASWEFAASPGPDDVLAARVKFMDVFGRLGTTPGVFRCAGREGKIDSLNKTETRVELVSPSGGEGKSDAPAISGRTVLSFANTGKTGQTLSPRNDLRLLARGDGFGVNAFRAWIVLSAVLSMAVATGVFFGACFGRSVAVFCVMGFLVLTVSAPATVEEFLDPLSSTSAERLGMALATAGEAAVSPLNAFHPIASLESRECVEWREVARAAFVGFFAYPAVFALLSAAAMGAKRE